MNDDTRIWLAIAIPLLGAVAIACNGRRPNLRESVTLVAAVLLAANVWMLLPAIQAGARPGFSLAEWLPGLGIAFRVEPLGALFAALASTLWVVTSVYSIGYMRGNGEQRQTRFYVCFAIAIAATMGVAFSGNLLTLFLCYEALTLSTYPLVAHRGDRASLRAARVYLGILLATSMGLLLPALVWTYYAAGTLDFVPGGILADRLGAPALGALLALYLLGIGKAAIMPVHRWLPAAMVAPTPVSALLHAVAVVKTGVFTITKVIVYVFGPEQLALANGADALVVLVAFTAVVASIVALQQVNLKRLLAYSTVAQLSFIVMAGMLLAPLAAPGTAVHLVAHALAKITLFFAAGAIYTASKKTEVAQLDGIARRMPWTAAAFTVAAFSMIGLPPFGGYASKSLIAAGAVHAGSWLALGVIAASTLLNAAYFLPIMHRAWLRPEQAAPHREHGEAPVPMVAAIVTTAVLTIVLFFLYPAVLSLEVDALTGAPATELAQEGDDAG